MIQIDAIHLALFFLSLSLSLSLSLFPLLTLFLSLSLSHCYETAASSANKIQSSGTIKNAKNAYFSTYIHRIHIQQLDDLANGTNCACKDFTKSSM